MCENEQSTTRRDQDQTSEGEEDADLEEEEDDVEYNVYFSSP